MTATVRRLTLAARQEEPGREELGRAHGCAAARDLGMERRLLVTKHSGRDSMFRRFTKKRMMVVVAAVAALAITAAAVAYFTSTGAGTGTDSVGSTNTNVAISGTTASDLYPNGPAADMTITVTNNDAGAEYVNMIHPTGITPDAGHTSCDVSLNSDGSAFTMGDIQVAQDIQPGKSVTVHGSLQMNDTNVSQMSCRNAGLTVNFTSN
jgi:hypothetical protein